MFFLSICTCSPISKKMPNQDILIISVGVVVRLDVGACKMKKDTIACVFFAVLQYAKLMALLLATA